MTDNNVTSVFQIKFLLSLGTWWRVCAMRGLSVVVDVVIIINHSSQQIGYLRTSIGGQSSLQFDKQPMNAIAVEASMNFPKVIRLYVPSAQKADDHITSGFNRNWIY